VIKLSEIMDSQSGTSVRGMFLVVSLATLLGLNSTARAETMPSAQQNLVVQKYCGSCHSDALMYGGLSVEHFDAAHTDPTLAAMLVSKLTNGHSPRDVSAAAQGADSDATILALMKNSAMGAAGGGVPDEATQVAFVKALSAEAAGADEWVVVRDRTLTASIVREVPSTKFAGRTDMYRLILSCRVDSNAGEIKLAWANGVPEEGRPITVAVDGRAPFIQRAEGGKEQGNGANGPGAAVLYPRLGAGMTFPAQRLSIGNVFPDETLEFPLEGLNPGVRRELGGCFGGNE
jgi:hypothetical protein